MTTLHNWSVRWVGYNFWAYFLGPAGWCAQFPFVQDIKLPTLPVGHGVDEHPFGVLTNLPVVWLAAAVPLAWRGRSAEVRGILRGFIAAVVLIFATRVLTLCFFRSTSARYEMEFCPALVLLAVLGTLGLERAVAGRPAWRRASRWAWGLLLAFSLSFSLLAGATYYAEYHRVLGIVLYGRGQTEEAIHQFQQALVLKPDSVEAHSNLGVAFGGKGQIEQAIHQYQEAVRLKPDFAEGHYDLGTALGKKGQVGEAIRQYQEALRLNPDYAEAHNSLGAALDDQGQTDEAIRQYQEALRLKPGYAEAHNNLGLALVAKGQSDEAIRQYRQALRLKPDYADAHINLGVAFGRKGQIGEGIVQLREALRLKRDNAVAHCNLGVAFYRKGQLDAAIGQLREALRLRPGYAEARQKLDILLATKANPPPSPGASTNR